MLGERGQIGGQREKGDRSRERERIWGVADPMLIFFCSPSPPNLPIPASFPH